MEVIEAPIKIADGEFMVECTRRRSILRFSIFTNYLNLEHYGWEDGRIKMSQNWEFSPAEAGELLSKLKKRGNIAFASSERLNHCRTRMRYKAENISFEWFREEEYEYLTISYYVNTKPFNKKIIGWSTTIEDKQISPFIERIEQLIGGMKVNQK